jgi:hypothetical protein
MRVREGCSLCRQLAELAISGLSLVGGHGSRYRPTVDCCSGPQCTARLHGRHSAERRHLPLHSLCAAGGRGCSRLRLRGPCWQAARWQTARWACTQRTRGALWSPSAASSADTSSIGGKGGGLERPPGRFAGAAAGGPVGCRVHAADACPTAGHVGGAGGRTQRGCLLRLQPAARGRDGGSQRGFSFFG